ncbi:MAG TPA: twin-arginine translocase subunit TatC [Pontiella sp.]
MIGKIKSVRERFRYDESEAPLLEHLEDFRKTVIRCLICLATAMLPCLFFADHLIAVLRAPAEPYIEKSVGEQLDHTVLKLRVKADNFADKPNRMTDEDYYSIPAEVEGHTVDSRQGVIRLQFSEPAAAVKMWLSVSFFGGVLLSLPLLVFFIGLFVMPGVRENERKLMTRVAFFSGGLFLLGIYMGYKVTLPLALGLMLKIGAQLGGESIWFYNKYIAFALQLLLGFGLAFQLPVVILILGKMGLLNSGQLREKRRHVIVGLLVLAMLLTPPDVLTQLLMAGPLILMYEFCIWFLHFTGSRSAAVTADDKMDNSSEE